MTRDPLRAVILRPYRKGYRPTFRLDLWDTGRTGAGTFGKAQLGYRLVRLGYVHTCGIWAGDEWTTVPGRWLPGRWRPGAVIFEGEDYGCSPCHAIDSDEAVRGILSFLTLRPGDTDREYFEGYTPAQLEYCDEHAESLSMFADEESDEPFEECKGSPYQPDEED